MATTKQMIDRKEDTLSTQRETNRLPPIRSTLSTQDPRPWQSTLRFQDITKEIISKSKRTSGARTHRSAPPTPSSMAATPSGSGKDSRYSFADVVAITAAKDTRRPITAAKDTRRPSSHPVSRLPNSTGNLERVNQTLTSTASNNPAPPKIVVVNNLSDASSEIRVNTLKAAARAGVTSTGSRVRIRDPAATGNTRPNELCKDCKTSLRESFCFITNDGRISAASTGSAYARNVHRCNVSGCAANRSYYPPPSRSISQKEPYVFKPQASLNCPRTRLKERTVSGVGDHSKRLTASSSVLNGDCNKQETESCSMGSVETPSIRGYDMPSTKQELTGTVETSSIRGYDVPNMKQELNLTSSSGFAIQCREEGGESHTQTVSLCPPSTDQNGLHDRVGPCSADGAHSPPMQAPKDEPNYGQNDHMVEIVDVCSPPAASCVSCDTYGDDDDDDKGTSAYADEDDKGAASAYADDIRALNDFSSLLYHGDNEYSWSEDGTNATTTPNSMIKGAFEDLSNIDIEHTRCENRLAISQPSRSSVARMRQRYLEALSKQEAEKVRLRKQEIMARKQSGDWMLDCHMGEVLHKLAPNGEVRVKVLVEAFETVAQHSDSESSQAAHHQDQDHQAYVSA